MIRTEKRLRLCLTLLVLNLCFIWGNSLLPGEISGALSDWVKGLISALLPGDDGMPGGGGLLRKLAHFTEFATLGMCLCWLMGMLRKHTGLAWICGVAVACVDETIQRFVPDRGPSIRDVGIDSCGVAVGILLLLAGYTIRKKKFSGGK